MMSGNSFTRRPHPRVATRTQKGPIRLADQEIGFNGRFAAALTRRVGSMWVVYFTTLFVLVWITLATFGPLRSVDPYPFAFMLFIGNVVQLLLVFVILVGQQ